MLTEPAYPRLLPAMSTKRYCVVEQSQHGDIYVFNKAGRYIGKAVRPGLRSYNSDTHLWRSDPDSVFPIEGQKFATPEAAVRHVISSWRLGWLPVILLASILPGLLLFIILVGR